LPLLGLLMLLGCAPAINTINEITGRSQRVAPTIYRLPEPGAPADSPPPWSDLNLQGRLILIRHNPDGNRLIEVDLGTGNTKLLFQAPERSLLADADVSPDGARIILAYSPPPVDNEMQLGYTQLYLMPSDGSGQPEPFLIGAYADEAFYHPVWSPDGQHVYYTHLYRREGDKAATHYRIERTRLSGESEVVVGAASWPSISSDGSRLAYLTLDPQTSVNELYMTDLVRGPGAPVITAEDLPTVDAHLFSPDGRAIYFSAVNKDISGASWFEKIDGVAVAYAHNVPSDWYRVAVQDGEVERLTHIGGTGLVGDFSPDGKYFAFYSEGGLFLMKPDGSEIRALANAVLVGSLNWLP
jgi:Tol biopolymer transport system component